MENDYDREDGLEHTGRRETSTEVYCGSKEEEGRGKTDDEGGEEPRLIKQRWDVDAWSVRVLFVGAEVEESNSLSASQSAHSTLTLPKE